MKMTKGKASLAEPVPVVRAGSAEPAARVLAAVVPVDPDPWEAVAQALVGAEECAEVALADPEAGSDGRNTVVFPPTMSSTSIIRITVNFAKC